MNKGRLSHFENFLTMYRVLRVASRLIHINYRDISSHTRAVVSITPSLFSTIPSKQSIPISICAQLKHLDFEALETPSRGFIIEEDVHHTTDDSKEMYLDSVLRKRRLKMKKHKLKKRRKAQRALKKRLGKI